MEQILDVASLSDRGMVRPHNEDSIAAHPDLGFVVLADGMGGYNAGEVASGIAVTVISEALRQALTENPRRDGGREPSIGELAREVVENANHAIHRTSQTQPQCAGMGTTLVMAVFHDNRVTVAHVGDSRLYRLRDEKLEQITRDHSLLQEQIDSGLISKEAARQSRNKNLVTRALGVDPAVDVEVREYPVQPDDIYLLCSDGLTDMVEEDEIQLTLSVLGANLPLAAQQLVQMANDNGGRDNISVIVVKILRDFAQEYGWFSRFLGWLR